MTAFDIEYSLFGQLGSASSSMFQEVGIGPWKKDRIRIRCIEALLYQLLDKTFNNVLSLSKYSRFYVDGLMSFIKLLWELYETIGISHYLQSVLSMLACYFYSPKIFQSSGRDT